MEQIIKKTIIAISTYNEAEDLSDITHEVLTQVPSIDVLIVDDNPPDGTGRLAEELDTKDPHIHVLYRQRRSGLGPTCLAASTWASGYGYTWVGEFDADGSHRPQDLLRLLAMARDTTRPDLMVGSRWVRGDGTRGQSKKCGPFSHVGNFYASMVLDLRVYDATAGFRAYCVDFLNRLL